ncbi:MAG: glycosyltransferase family 4 protein [Pseudomonadota bacterium]|nr:glycosyltransferase family 4 protein [Pseudomonadota bacterium]
MGMPMPAPAKRIAMIVQRYGADVNGGAEVMARMIAEKLAAHYDVTVLTSCALDYHTWKPVLAPGDSEEGGVHVKRFTNLERASRRVQAAHNRKLDGRTLGRKVFRWLKEPGWWNALFPPKQITYQDNVDWLQAQGPCVPELVGYLRHNKEEYAAFIFFTALYYPTAMGIVEVAGKSILIPTMHDERASYFPIYQQVMASAAWLFFNTSVEQEFSEKLFPIEQCKKAIVATGIELDDTAVDSAVPAKFNIHKPYLIYVGRVDKSKGCDVLLDYFTRFSASHGSPLQLVLVGKNSMEESAGPDVFFTGFVSDAEKIQLMKQAQALLMPSLFESLSLVLLESFACKVPVIANLRCEVLKDHLDQSEGGWLYATYGDFERILTDLLGNESGNRRKGDAGHRYVVDNYSWDSVIKKYKIAIEDICNNH